MVAPLRRLTFGPEAGPAKSKQKALAPPLGASLVLGIPVIRHCCVRPPQWAIHGPVRLNRHPCRFAPHSNIEFRPAWFDGAPKIKIKIRSKAEAKPVGGAAEGCESGIPDTPLFAAFGSSYKNAQIPGECGRCGSEFIRECDNTNNDYSPASSHKPVGSQAAALLILILGAPSNHAGRTQGLNRGMLLCWRGAGRRVSRIGPWMARCGGPRFKPCVRVHRAPARCRVVGQGPFGHFWLGWQSRLFAKSDAP
jgi:hypothetical protein